MNEVRGPIRIVAEIRDRLKMAMLDERELLGALRRSTSERLDDGSGAVRCRPTLAVPHALDPEYAEVRQLEVLLQPAEAGWEVFAIHGLELEGI